MKRTRLIATAGAAAAVLAGTAACSSSSKSVPVHTARPAATHAQVTSMPPSLSPSPTAVLPLEQAAAEYLRIADPINRTLGAVNADVSDRVSWAQFRHDALALIAATRTADRQLEAVRWPTKVQPWVNAMAGTYDVASIGCTQTEVNAGSYTAAQNATAGDPDCTAESNTADPDQIRTLLGLPPING